MQTRDVRRRTRRWQHEPTTGAGRDGTEIKEAAVGIAAASAKSCWAVAGVCALLAVPTAVDPDGWLAWNTYLAGLGLIVAALWWGAARWQGPTRTGWRFVAAAASCWLIGDVLQRMLAAGGIKYAVGPPDLFWLASYPLLIAAVATMIRGKGLTERVRREIRLDVTAVTAAAALGIWRIMIAPGLDGGTLSLASVVATLYPLGDIAIVGMALTLLVAPGRRRVAGSLLIGCLATTLVLDTAYTVLPTALPSFNIGRLDALLLVVNSLLAVAVLHPSGGAVAEPIPGDNQTVLMHRWRVALLGAALITVSSAAALPYGKSTAVDRLILLAAAGAVSITVLQRFYGVVREREQAEILLTRSETRFHELADHSPDLVLHVSREPELHIDYVSPSFEALTGIPAAAVQDDLALFADASDQQTLSMLADAAAGRPLPPQFDSKVRRADGTYATLEVRIVEMPDGIQGVGRDVTEIRALQAQLAEQATRDPLTGLANRRLLDELLNRALRGAGRSGTIISVAFLDLDEFKSVNDTYGHDAGDTVLRVTATRLQAAVRDADVVARYGGDEFVVVSDASEHTSDTRLRDRIQASLDIPIDIGNGISVSCPPSIGVADTHTIRPDADALITAADHAMLENKRERQRSRRTRVSATSAEALP